MVRLRGLVYLALAFLLLMVMIAFTSESFSLNSLLHPLKPAPRILKPLVPLIQELNRDDIPADHVDVIKIIKEQFLIKPSKEPYNLNNPEESNPSMGQAQRIDFILKGKQNGFYIECGGLDGELRSNTLFFERERGWNGLLIEADPKNFEQMITKQRKAWLSPACLAPVSHPTSVQFQQEENQGHIVGKQDKDSPGSEMGAVVDVQCFPLYSYLLALNQTTVDYFSLDVEGAELSVLKTIPWEKVDIKTLSVEFIHGLEGKEAIRTYMLDKGYYVNSEVTHPDWLANDFIFVKRTKELQTPLGE